MPSLIRLLVLTAIVNVIPAITALVTSGANGASSVNLVVSTDRLETAARTPTLQSELDAEGLGLCHGILHASGVRCKADMKDLTKDQLAEMGADNFDRREMDRVIAGFNSPSSPKGSQAIPPAELVTSIEREFDSHVPDRFEVLARHDFEITAIDEKYDIYRGRMFTQEQCKQLVRMSEYSAYRGIGTSTVGSGWGNEIYTLTSQHMQCKDVPGFLHVTKQLFRDLLEEMHSLFPDQLHKGSIDFATDTEPHLVKYSGKARGTKMHTDNSQFVYITVNVLLSDNADFDGGGTYIKVLDDTIRLEQGEMLIHLGDLEHAGADITSGVRHLLIAFLKCEWIGGRERMERS